MGKTRSGLNFGAWLLRRTVTKNATARAHIKELRQQYRASLRRERSEYWGARLNPGKYPEEWMTNISDGATQKCVCRL